MNQFTGGTRRETTPGHHMLALRMALRHWVRLVIPVMGMSVLPASRTATPMIDGAVAGIFDTSCHNSTCPHSIPGTSWE